MMATSARHYERLRVSWYSPHAVDGSPVSNLHRPGPHPMILSDAVAHHPVRGGEGTGVHRKR